MAEHHFSELKYNKTYSRANNNQYGMDILWNPPSAFRKQQSAEKLAF